MIEAFVFDFDGVVCDTEFAEYESVRRVWAAHGADLTGAAWSGNVGRSWGVPWLDDLEALVGPIDRTAAIARRHEEHAAIIGTLGPLPGVLELWSEADAHSIPIAVASNSDYAWVDGQLRRLGLRDRVRAVRTIDRVPNPKPAPDPFALACADVGADPRRSVGFEDSETGTTAALAAGLFVVAVPHALTAGHDVSAAQWVVESLTEVTVARLAVRCSP
jgi:HAD superfamily hydrolase (TIGR01509 family)